MKYYRSAHTAGGGSPPPPPSPPPPSGSTPPPGGGSPPPGGGGFGSPLITPTTSTLSKMDLNSKGAKTLHAIDKFSPDDKDNIAMQAERKHGLRSPAAVLNTTKSISDLRGRGERLLFERKSGESTDSLLRKGLDAAYLTSQAGSQVMPDEDAHEFSGTTATRKAILGATDIIRIAATAEKKRKPTVEETPTPVSHESSPEAPETPVTRPSRRDREQYRRVRNRQAALNGEPPTRAIPKDMSKEEMRDVIRNTNKENRAQSPNPQAARNAARRQQRAHRNSQRRNNRSRQRTSTSQGTANQPTQNTAPTSAATPAPTSAPNPTAAAPAPNATPEVAPAVTPTGSNPAQPGRNNRRGNNRPRQRKPPEGQIPITPLQHGEPPSLATPTPAPAAQKKKPKKKPKKPDKKDSKLNHADKKDNESKLNFDDKRSNTVLAQSGRYIRGKAADKVHSKISDSEKDLGNTGLESVHKAEQAAEKAHNARRKVSRLRHHIKTRHIRRANKAKAKAIRREGKLARQALNNNPAYKGKPLSKALQKMRIKRQYAQAARAAKAGKTAVTTTKAAATTAKSAAMAVKMIALKAKAAAAAKALIFLLGKIILAIILIVVLLVLVVSCVGMIGGGFTAILDGLSYQADMDDMTEYSVYMTKLELDFAEDVHAALSPSPPAHEVVLIVNAPDGSQTFSFPPTITGHGGVFLDGTQTSSPMSTVTPSPLPTINGLMAFLPDITHCPFELMAYLTIVHGDFSDSNMNEVIQDLFSEVFQFSYSDESTTFPLTVPVEHWVTDDEGVPVQVSPFTTVINVPLNIRTVTVDVNGTISEAIHNRLYNMSDEEENPYLEHFEFLMYTRGLRQFVGSPFEDDWTGLISSPFGYRLHPVYGNRHMHTGIDIAKPEGTPIMGGLDGGTVTAAEDMGGYGLTVIIEYIDEETGVGVRVLYAHMYQIDVAVGDVLELGAIIGTVGETGTATGPHLHLEVFISDDSGANWRRINPKFFVEPFPPEPE